MGLCKINLESIILSVARKFGWTKMPSIRELKIPFSSVSSGIIMSDGIRESIESKKPGILNSIVQFTTHSWNAAFQNASSIAGILSSSQAVIPVEFGLDSITQSMPVCDAVSFSILVPGVLNFELPQNHYRSLDILNSIFKEKGLYRLCDGGVARNVPVETARQAVESGAVGHENVYILGVDVFAPQLDDPFFYPLEEIANKNAVVSAEEADSFVRLKDLLSPVNLAPSLAQLKWQNARFRNEFGDEMKIIVRAMKPLPPLKSLEISE